jgi:hypothetical protein
MEDSHIANVKLDNGCSLFGVFDGHGGKEHYFKLFRTRSCIIRKKILHKNSNLINKLQDKKL